jgi:molecular chaperone IbpA
LAVAGFGQGDIDVSVQDGQLIITGDRKLPDNNVVYQHQGISARRFIRTFQLGDYVEVTTALAKDGILTVQLERVVPEAMKPKTIAITYIN